MSSDSSALEIADLRNRADLVDSVVTQNVEQWGDFTNIDENTMADLFRADNPTGSLPVTLVAVVGGRYAGCVSLRERTMGMLTHPEVYLDESPWLSNMWVADWARGGGVASGLTAALEAVARSMNITRIFSSTAHPNSLYHKLGYVDIEQRPFQSETIYLISKDIT